MSSNLKGKSRALEEEVTAEGSRLTRASSPGIRKVDTEGSSAGSSRPRSPRSTDVSVEDADTRPADPFEGMTEEEIFKIVTRPAEIEGLSDWGIPLEVDPDQASDTLKVSL